MTLVSATSPFGLREFSWGIQMKNLWHSLSLPRPSRWRSVCRGDRITDARCVPAALFSWPTLPSARSLFQRAPPTVTSASTRLFVTGRVGARVRQQSRLECAPLDPLKTWSPRTVGANPPFPAEPFSKVSHPPGSPCRRQSSTPTFPASFPAPAAGCGRFLLPSCRQGFELASGDVNTGVHFISGHAPWWPGGAQVHFRGWRFHLGASSLSTTRPEA